MPASSPMPFRTPPRLCAVALVVTIAACTSGSDAWIPLESPRWWYYEIHETVLDEARESRYMVVNAGRGSLGGQDVYLQIAQSGSVDYLRYAGQGVERLASRRPGKPGVLLDEPTRVVLPESPVTGATWSVPTTLGLIESRTFARADRLIVSRIPVTLEKMVAATDASTTTPAGRFDACLRVDGTGRVFVRTDRGNSEAAVVVRTSDWYARDIGLVRLERTEQSESSFLKNGEQVWELTDFGR